MEIKGKNRTITISKKPITILSEAVDEYAMLKTEMASGDWSHGVQNMLNNRCTAVQQFILNYILNTRKAFLIWANKQERKVKQVKSETKNGKENI